jgi:hypothetical protein
VSKSSQHWYDRDGNAVFEVAKAKGGGTRPTTIADARKLGLYPSVTTVLGVLDKPQLMDWKLAQVSNWCHGNPPQDNEGVDSYARRATDGAFRQVSDAADLGTAIHAALESHFKGDPVPEGYDAYVYPVSCLIEKEGIKFREHELRLVNVRDGYAGTTDAVFTDSIGFNGILDFKSRKTKPGQPCTPWETEPMQIAAYCVAKFGRIHHNTTGANVYISTTEKGRVEIVNYSATQLEEAWDAFQAALKLWQYLKGYKPPIV